MFTAVEYGKSVRKCFYDVTRRHLAGSVGTESMARAVFEAWMRSPERATLLARIGSSAMFEVES